jgi:hypothetical protein
MKAARFLFPLSMLAFTCGWTPAQAQTNSPPAPPPPAPKPHVVDVPQPDQPTPAASSADPAEAAKIAEYQKRFANGNALEQLGKLAEARAIYDGILAEEPKAKGSLLHAGEISFELGDMAKADDYFERLHEIVPDFPEAIAKLIQINQALKRDVKVELLIRDFGESRNSGKMPQLTQ